MGLGAGELVLILVIAYVVVGPEDMAKLAKTLAKTIRQLKKMSADLSREVGSGLQLSPVSDLTGEVRVPSGPDRRNQDPVRPGDDFGYEKNRRRKQHCQK